MQNTEDSAEYRIQYCSDTSRMSALQATVEVMPGLGANRSGARGTQATQASLYSLLGAEAGD